jgi:hypothetical protein
MCRRDDGRETEKSEMEKAFRKRLMLIGLKVIRELAMSMFEEHAGQAPQPVYEAIMKLVEDTLEAETRLIQWDTRDDG